MRNTKELMSFIRLKVVVVLTLIATAGFLMFNSRDFNLLLLAAVSPGVAAVYGYNNLTDAKEDWINRKKLNKFVSMRRLGTLIVLILTAVSIVFSAFLNPLAFLSVLGFIVIGLAYSKFRLKRFSLIKNLTTALIISLLFLAGALVGSSLTNSILLASFLVFVYIKVGSIVSDLRDYEGDKAVGLKTTPVVFGKRVAKYLSNFLLFIYCWIILYYGLVSFYIVLPFALLMVFHITQDRYVKAHNLSMLSFLFLNIWVYWFIL